MSETVVTVLMPKMDDAERFRIRYRNLEAQLGQLGVRPTFAESHTSYDPVSHNFDGHFSSDRQIIDDVSPENIAVVRDLTIPKNFAKPLYEDEESPQIVNDPALNIFLRNKANLFNRLPELHPDTVVVPQESVISAVSAICSETVVVKPVEGMLSRGVYIGPKEDVPSSMAKGDYLVQEYINTSGGIPELAIKGIHNVRLLSVNSQILGAVGRIKGSEALLLRDDIYGRVYLPEELPESMLAIADIVHRELTELPGKGKNVIAIDLMRGINSSGNEVDVICEVNHRPLRISEYDLLESQEDPKGIKWLAAQWDKYEAEMLANVAQKREN